MHRIIITLTVAFIASAGAAYGQLQAEGAYWLMTPEGTGSVGIDGVEGTEFDVEDDLGYGDDEGAIMASLYLGDRHQFGINFLQMDISADNQLDKNLRYKGLLFRVNTEVESSMEATLIGGFYRMNFGDDSLRGGLVLGGQYLDFSGGVSAEDVGRVSADIKVGMPVVGGYLRMDPMEMLSVRGAINGLTWKFDDVDATYWNAEGSVSLMMRGLYLGAGYRYLVIEVTDDGESIDADLTFSGPFAVAGFEW